MKIEMVNSKKRLRLRKLVIGHVAVLSFSFLLINPFHAGAQTSPTIDCNVTTLSAGGRHTVGLKEDGTVVAVGHSSYGQLNVSNWTNIKSISAGEYYTVGLKEDGTVVAVGENVAGQLNVTGWRNITAISAGMAHTVGLKGDGTVVVVGYNNYGQLNVSGWTDITAISAGYYQTVGLKENGTVVGAGYNGYGQLNVSGWTDITAISAGLYHTVGLKGDGTVVAVGYNYQGQCNVSNWTNITAISAGLYHTVGLKGDGTVVGVGSNGTGQLNFPTIGWTNIRQPCSLEPTDSDGDGAPDDTDCNDNDNTIYPGATELCDGIDNNCDGEIDEGVKNTYYRDADGDTFGDPDNTTQACSQPSGYVTNNTDCDDSDVTVYPGAPELCDGKDNDCDGIIPAGEVDADGDGYMVCEGDCDDSSAIITVCGSSPAEAIEILTDIIDSLNFQQGVENALIAKLDAATESLLRGNDNTAVNQLEAFINQITAQSGKEITAEDAQSVIKYVQRIIAAINAG